jgi:hypothetical protein
VKGIAMSEHDQQVEEGPGTDTASDEIARSLGSVWLRYSGQRPRSTKVEMRKDAVTCVIEERADTPADEASEEADDARLSPAGLQHNATAAIARITGRRVIAFIAKRDKKAEVSTQTFLLDQPLPRY